MKNYKVLMDIKTYEKAFSYLEQLKAGKISGKYLFEALKNKDISKITTEEFIELLLNTKKPQIFAETSVYGDGKDWNNDELSILGDIGIAAIVTIFDNGKHYNPDVHKIPLTGTLLFTPGALLRNGRNCTPADWEEVTKNNEIDSEAYYKLYERRLLPLFMYANQFAKSKGNIALITIPGLGCGQFAGKFIGHLGFELQNVLINFLKKHESKFSNIKTVYYDPFQECENERFEINGISLLIRPLTKGNEHKPQLCYPKNYEEIGDNFEKYELFSLVAWDHVSWPGNDFYKGFRTTDDGVKAAATNLMKVITGIEGKYDISKNEYDPPNEYENWEEVVLQNNKIIEVINNLMVF